MSFLSAAPLATGLGYSGSGLAAAELATGAFSAPALGYGAIGTTAATVASTAGATSWKDAATIGLPVAASVAGQMVTNKETAQVANTTADILEYNKAVAEADAAAALKAGAVEELKLDRQKKLVLSTQKSKYSASGFTLSGTPLAIMADTAAQFELDKSTIRTNAQTLANRYRSQATVYGMQAGAQRTKADNSGMTNALLTGVTSASKYLAGYGGRYGNYYSSL